MLLRILLFLIGFGLTVIGLTYMTLFLNYLTIGYTFKEYVNFIIRQFECYYVIICFIIIFLSINMSGGEKNDIC